MKSYVNVLIKSNMNCFTAFINIANDDKLAEKSCINND